MHKAWRRRLRRLRDELSETVMTNEVDDLERDLRTARSIGRSLKDTGRDARRSIQEDRRNAR